MTENYKESGDLLNDIKSIALESCTDDMIQYYFFSGLYEFIRKDSPKLLIFIELLKVIYIKSLMKSKGQSLIIKLPLHTMKFGKIIFP